MAKELGPIQVALPPVGAPDTSLISQGISKGLAVLDEAYQQDVLGEFREELNRTTDEITPESTVAAQEVTQDDLDTGTLSGFSTYMARLKNASVNAPTASARRKAELELKRAVSNAMNRANTAGMKDKILKEYRVFLGTDPELEELALADASIAAASSSNPAQDQIDAIVDYARNTLNMPADLQFGTEAFARQYTKRRERHERQTYKALVLEDAKTSDALAAREVEEAWYSNIRGDASEWRSMYEGLTNVDSLFHRVYVERQALAASGSEGNIRRNIQMEQEWANEKPRIIANLQVAKANATKMFNDVWGRHLNSPEATAARQALRDELGGLDTIVTLLQNDKDKEAYEVIRTAMAYSEANVLDRSPTIAAIRAMTDALGQDGVALINKTDYFHNSTATMTGITKGLIDDLDGFITDGVALRQATEGVPISGAPADINRALDSNINKHANPGGHNQVDTPEDKAIVGWANLDMILEGARRVPTFGPKSASERVMGLNYNMRLLTENADALGTDDYDGVNKSLVRPELPALLEKTPPDIAKAFAETLQEYYRGGSENDARSFEEQRITIAQLWSTPITGELRLSDVLDLDRDRLKEGTITFRLREDRFPQDPTGASYWGGSSDRSISLRRAKNLMRQLETKATMYNSLQAVLLQSLAGGGVPVDYEMAFVNPQDVRAGLNSLLNEFSLESEVTGGGF